MGLYREQPEPYMYSDKARNHNSYRWAKKQMHKYLRLKNKKIKDDDRGGYGKPEHKGWEF